MKDSHQILSLNFLEKSPNPQQKLKKKIDQQAAAYILQGFLDNAKNNH